MSLPLVTVIIPAYNSEKYIFNCINSVINQTYKNIEIIVIDDGSTDRTPAIIDELCIKYNNIQRITIPNSGPSNARNNGIARAKGEYIAFLDSDDEWLANKLELQIDCLLKNPSIALLGCMVTIGNNAKVNCSGITYINKYKFLFKNYIYTPTVIIRKDVLDKYKFNTKRKYSEDYLLWLNISFNDYKCFLMKDILVRLSDKPIYGGSGLSGKLWDMEKGELSNYIFLYKNKKISLVLYIVASIFSFMKFVKRVIITNFRKL